METQDGEGPGADGKADTPYVRRGGFGHAMAADPRDAEECKEAALRLLDAADRPTGTLRAKLLERGYADGVVDGVIDRLVELGLVDDEGYAESVVRVCANRMMGERGTVMELVRKGVERPLAARVAAEAAARGVFEDAAWELGRSVAKRTRGLEPKVRKRRFWGAGARKGHDSATLGRVANALFGDGADEEE
ncbi:MAG: regulatory protein RecX [Bifidobacterium sp.]|nr:regulatory protein RecX [Bifidobacterium sp.]